MGSGQIRSNHAGGGGGSEWGAWVFFRRVKRINEHVGERGLRPCPRSCDYRSLSQTPSSPSLLPTFSPQLTRDLFFPRTRLGKIELTFKRGVMPPREHAATALRGGGYINLRDWAMEIGSAATAGDIADVRFYGVNTITSSVVHLKVSGDRAVNDWVWGAGKTDTGAGLPAWETMAGVQRLPGHTAVAAGVLGCRDGSGCGGGIFTRCDKARYANLWSFEERTFGVSPDSTGRHEGCLGRCWERRLQQEEHLSCPTLGCLLRQGCNNGAPGGWAGEISVHQVWVRMKQDVVLVNGIDPSPELDEGGCIEIVKEHVPEQPPTPGVLTLLKQASLDEDTVENMAMPDDVPLELQNLMVSEVRGSVAEDDRCFVCNGTGERHVAMNMVYGEEAATADEDRTHDAVHFLLEKMAGVAVSATATLHRDKDTRPASFTLGGVLRDPSGLVLEARPMNTSGHSVFRSLLYIKAIIPKSAAASASGINLAVNDVIISAGGRDIAGYTVERAMKVIDELMRTEGGVLELVICRGVVASGDMHGGGTRRGQRGAFARKRLRLTLARQPPLSRERG